MTFSEAMDPATITTDSFTLAGSARVARIEWTPVEGSDGGIQLRYRCASTDNQPYGGWTSLSRRSPVFVGRVCKNVEYQIVFPSRTRGFAAVDEVTLVYEEREEDLAEAPGGSSPDGAGGSDSSDPTDTETAEDSGAQSGTQVAAAETGGSGESSSPGGGSAGESQAPPDAAAPDVASEPPPAESASPLPSAEQADSAAPPGSQPEQAAPQSGPQPAPSEAPQGQPPTGQALPPGQPPQPVPEDASNTQPPPGAQQEIPNTAEAGVPSGAGGVPGPGGARGAAGPAPAGGDNAAGSGAPTGSAGEAGGTGSPGGGVEQAGGEIGEAEGEGSALGGGIESPAGGNGQTAGGVNNGDGVGGDDTAGGAGGGPGGAGGQTTALSQGRSGLAGAEQASASPLLNATSSLSGLSDGGWIPGLDLLKTEDGSWRPMWPWILGIGVVGTTWWFLSRRKRKKRERTALVRSLLSARGTGAPIGSSSYESFDDGFFNRKGGGRRSRERLDAQTLDPTEWEIGPPSSRVSFDYEENGFETPPSSRQAQNRSRKPGARIPRLRQASSEPENPQQSRRPAAPPRP